MKKIMSFIKAVVLFPLNILMGADITASTAFRDFIANRLSSAGGCYYYVTLHDAGGSAITAGSSYATSGIGELATANGYTAGGKTAGTMTATAGVLDNPDVQWDTTAGQTLTCAYQALWVSTAATLTTAAKLVCLKESAQSGAGDGGYVKCAFTNPITIPTAA